MSKNMGSSRKGFDMINIKVLDCTLRDGGYLNDWAFGADAIRGILAKLAEANIDIIECGFLKDRLAFDPARTLYRSPSQLAPLLPQGGGGSKYVAMVNFGEYPAQALPSAEQSPVRGIRVVFHKEEAKEALAYCREVKEKGYDVFVQPMATANYTDLELLQILQEVNRIQPYAFYIVDSFGVMNRKTLLHYFDLADNNLSAGIRLGYHSHNNLQLAFANAQSLLNIHTERTVILDATVYGMGRGAGNLNTELITRFLNEEYTPAPPYNITPLLEIIDEYLLKLHEENYWGYSLPYCLSSTSNCHPNYATYFMEKNTLTVKSISHLLLSIPAERRAAFSKGYAEELYQRYQSHEMDDTRDMAALEELLHGKQVLVIMPGGSIRAKQDRLVALAQSPGTVTVSVNFLPDFCQPDILFVSNEKRLCGMMDRGGVISRIKTIITSNLIGQGYTPRYVVNLNRLVQERASVYDNAGLMLLQLLKLAGAGHVCLAGMDGYPVSGSGAYYKASMQIVESDELIRQKNSDMAACLQAIANGLDIEFITPTMYQG